jgi:hypothetical protein
MTEPIKLCKDCKWYKKNWFEHLTGMGDRFDKCLNPHLTGNVVTGKTDGGFCDNMRKYRECCGMEGKYWEAK